MLDVTGCIITADTMSCQKEIVKKITVKKADYVLGLKDNQPTMRREVREYFDAARRESQNYPAVQTIKTTDFGHGRIETRTYYRQRKLNGLKDVQIGVIFVLLIWFTHSKVEQQEKVTEDVRYFISSLEDISTFSEAMRKHWGIENALH